VSGKAVLCSLPQSAATAPLNGIAAAADINRAAKNNLFAIVTPHSSTALVSAKAATAAKGCRQVRAED
jgi:hypothetical protein